MIQLVLSKVSTKLSCNLKSGFTFSVNAEPAYEHFADVEKKQRDKWVKELAHFLKDNARTTRADDESDDDDDDAEDEDAEDEDAEDEDAEEGDAEDDDESESESE